MYKKVLLGELVEIDSGFAFKSDLFNSNEEGIPIIRIRDINSGIASTFYSGEYDNKYIVANGDLLISMDGSFVIKEWKGGKALLNQRVCRIRSKSTLLLNKYINYFLPNELKIIEDKTPFVTVKHLSVKNILNIVIDLPSVNIQEKIISSLDKAKELIDKRNFQIQLLDELIKSRFIDMCANGSSYYESWDKIRIEDIAEQRKGSMRTGPFGSSLLHSEFVNEGIFVLGIDNAVENYFAWNKMRYITEEKYEQLKNYTVFPGDIIITIMGTVGRSAVIPSNFPKAINTKHLACITLNKLIANPYFISYCIHKHPYVIQQLKSQSKGAIMDGLNLTIIKSIKIPLPPIEIQESFVNFMKQVDKLKFEMENSLKELENNFNSLMQKAFKGELFN